MVAFEGGWPIACRNGLCQTPKRKSPAIAGLCFFESGAGGSGNRTPVARKLGKLLASNLLSYTRRAWRAFLKHVAESSATP